MAAGTGITIYSPTGTGTQQQPQQVIFTTKYPFAKLDTQLGINLKVNPPATNAVSFQNFRIFFSKEPPVTIGSTSTTQIYQFAHGYTYIPTTWLLFQDLNAANTTASFTYGQENSIIVSKSALTFAEFTMTVDSTNVTFSVYKQWNALDVSPDVIGITLLLRLYVFVEPVLLS